MGIWIRVVVAGLALCVALCAPGCTDEWGGDDDGQPPGPDDDDSHPGDDDDSWPGDDDDAGDDDTDLPEPVWSCVSGLTMDTRPDPVTTDDVLYLDVTGDTAYVYVGMDGTGPGGASADPDWGGVTGEGPWTWSYLLGGLVAGRYDFTFTADEGATWLCDATVWVGTGGGGDDDDTTPGDDDDDTGSAGGPPDNPFGIGLVGPGDTNQWDRSAELCGRGGHVKLIFPGIEVGMSGPPQDWIDACNEVYARDLVPVIRMQTGWGQTNIRDMSDDVSHLSYNGLAGAFATAVAGLPKRDGWPMVIEPKGGSTMVAAYDMDKELAAIAAADYGKGRVVAFSPHPEGCIGRPGEFRDRDRLAIAYDPFEMNTAAMLSNAVYWVARRRIPAAKKK